MFNSVQRQTYAAMCEQNESKSKTKQETRDKKRLRPKNFQRTTRRKVLTLKKVSFPLEKKLNRSGILNLDDYLCTYALTPK